MGAVSGLTPPFKVTSFFRQTNGAVSGMWSETIHWKDVSYASVVTDLTTYIPARLALMCADCDYVSTRISYPGQKNQDLLVDANDIDLLTTGGLYVPTSTTASHYSCPLNTAILYRVRDALNFHTSMWLHGVPEAAVEGSEFVEDVAFASAFAAFNVQLAKYVMIKEGDTGLWGLMILGSVPRIRSRQAGRNFSR
jgi:hypothetical protein